MARRRLARGDYTIGWVCALPIELLAAQEVLDKEHEDLEQDQSDNNLCSEIDRWTQCCNCVPTGRSNRQQSYSGRCDADEGDLQRHPVRADGRYWRWCPEHRGGHTTRRRGSQPTASNLRRCHTI